MLRQMRNFAQEKLMEFEKFREAHRRTILIVAFKFDKLSLPEPGKSINLLPWILQ